MSTLSAHAVITLHKGFDDVICRVEFDAMLSNGSVIKGSDPSCLEGHERESIVVGQTIIRLLMLNGVKSFEFLIEDSLPSLIEYRGHDYEDDSI